MWKIPESSTESAKKGGGGGLDEDEEKEETELSDKKPILVSDVHIRLRSHRSIVNQCTFNRKHFLLATSGIEKLVKIWSPYSLPASSGGGLLGAESEYAPKRRLFTYSDLLEYRRQANEALRQTLPNQMPPLSPPPDTDEDKMMIAFFDFQLQQKYRRECGSLYSSVGFDFEVGDDSNDSDDDDDDDDLSSNSDDDDDDEDDDDDDDDSDSDSDDNEESDEHATTRNIRSDNKDTSTSARRSASETSTNTSFSDRTANRF
jgi:hypothetical protein